MADLLTGYVLRPGAGLIEDDPTLKASRRSTGGAISVFETSIQDGPPLHVHDNEDECFYVLEGELSVCCGHDAFDAPRGSFVFLPRGRSHRFWAKHGSARLLGLAVPGGIEDFFHEINAAATGQELHRIGEKYGIRVAAE